jgi:hypothetical protein
MKSLNSKKKTKAQTLTDEERAMLRQVLMSRELWDFMFDNGHVRPANIHSFAPEKYWRGQ